MNQHEVQSEIDKLERQYEELYWKYLELEKENTKLKRQLDRKNVST